MEHGLGSRDSGVKFEIILDIPKNIIFSRNNYSLQRLYSVPVEDEEPGDALRPRVRHHGLEELVDGDLQPIRGEDVVT